VTAGTQSSTARSSAARRRSRALLVSGRGDLASLPRNDHGAHVSRCGGWRRPLIVTAGELPHSFDFHFDSSPVHRSRRAHLPASTTPRPRRASCASARWDTTVASNSQARACDGRCTAPAIPVAAGRVRCNNAPRCTCSASSHIPAGLPACSCSPLKAMTSSGVLQGSCSLRSM
jgi:hypothetical protein